MLAFAFAGARSSAPREGRKINEWRDGSGKIFAQAFSRQDLSWIEWFDVGVFAFSADAHDVLVWPYPAARHEAIIDTFRKLQPIVLQALGWEALHASAAMGPAGVAAFCGRSGSGKSTIAFAMERAGWRQLADDALVLRLDASGVTACPLPFTPSLRSSSRAYFAAETAAEQPRPGGEVPDVPLGAIFLLRQDAALAAPRVTLKPRAQAFSEVLTHAHCFDAEDREHTRRLAQDYLSVIERTKVFMLEYRPDFRQLGQLIEAITEAAARADPKAAFVRERQPAVLSQ
jgi:hypothetical protein